MYCYKRLLLLSAVAIVPNASAVALSDSLLIEANYTQQGEDISRNQLEEFLLKQNASADLTDKSKAYGVSATAVGVPLWLISTGISVWQGIQCYKAIKGIYNSPTPYLLNKSILNEFTKWNLPLVIEIELSAFIPSFLNRRSDYLLHNAVRAYDSSVYQRYNMSVVMDHRIKEARPGWYLQDRLLMPTSVMYSVLKENEASHTAANTSLACRTIAVNAGFLGGIFLTNGIIGIFEKSFTKDNVDIKLRNTQLGVGAGLAFVAGIFSIISVGIRDKAIDYYNEPFQKGNPLTLQNNEFSPAPAAPTQQQHQ